LLQLHLLVVVSALAVPDILDPHDQGGTNAREAVDHQANQNATAQACRSCGDDRIEQPARLCQLDVYDVTADHPVEEVADLRSMGAKGRDCLDCWAATHFVLA
jgi:hypothetical protein